MSNNVLVDFSRLKLLCILEGPGATVLTYILKRGTQYQCSVHLDDYLMNLPPTCTVNYCQLSNRERKKIFDKSEVKQIRDDVSWNNFDISLLYKSIKLACVGVAGFNDPKWRNDKEMEGLITKIKEERNTCVHEKPQLTEQKFKHKVNDLEQLFLKTLKAAKMRYNFSDFDLTNLQDKINKDISYVIETFSDKMLLRMSFDKRMLLFKEEAKSHLKHIYRKAQYFDPFCFLSGCPETSLHVEKIFSKVILKEKTKNTETDITDLLEHSQSGPKSSHSTQSTHSPQNERPNLVMISGISGSGKTTLLTFILAEWLKDECDRRMKGLQNYDIVLRILCRERDGPSLCEYLNQTFPYMHMMFNESLDGFLRHCKVLFLIDGLDELNSSSDQLLNDIIEKGKNVHNFTIIITSRPERVIDFMALTRENYHQWEACIEGIRPSERTEFVLKYFSCLPHSRSIDLDMVIQVIQNIVWRDHFGLPLNLLFLATLLHDDPTSVKQNTTQFSLYTSIHLWCVEKLQYRLAKKLQIGNDRRFREISIKKVLRLIYQMALKNLLEDRLSLSEEDIMQLKECCKAEQLPCEDILGSFFSLRQSIEKLRIIEKYYVPHKGIQEFFAAHHILRSLQHTSLHGLGTITSIKAVLQDSLKTQSLKLWKLRNLFLHVAGLISQTGTSYPEAAKEVIDLLFESGVRYSEIWLSLLAETNINSDMLQRIAHYVISNPRDDKIRIWDSTVVSAVALLPLIPRKKIRIELRRKGVDIRDLYRPLNGHKCTRLNIWHHYKCPSKDPDSDPVLRAFPRSELEEFAGHLCGNGLLLLPRTMKNILLTVCNDDHARQLFPILHQVMTNDHEPCNVQSSTAIPRASFPHLQLLYMHIPLKKISLAGITSCLPDAHDAVNLVLSEIEDNMIELAWRVTKALQPRRGYRDIRIVSAHIKAASLQDLLEKFEVAHIAVASSIAVPEAAVTVQEVSHLNIFSLERLGCTFERLPEEALWV